MIEALTRGALRWVERRLPSLGPPGVTVFAYHLVAGGTQSAVDLPSVTFRAQLSALKRVAGVKPLSEATRDPRSDVPSSLAVLTFDDAYQNFYDTIWPLLREHNLPATLYVPVDFIEGRTRPPIARTDHLPPCTWAQLREMADAGLDIGSHSITHRNLSRLPDAEARREIEDSKKLLEDKLGHPVTSFCYPQAKRSPRLEPFVRATYETAVIGGGFKLHPKKTDPHRIPRVSIRRDMPEDILPLLDAPVCLEELLGDLTRRFRP